MKYKIVLIFILMFFLSGCITIKYNDIEKNIDNLCFESGEFIVGANVEVKKEIYIQGGEAVTNNAMYIYLTVENIDYFNSDVYISRLNLVDKKTNKQYQIESLNDLSNLSVGALEKKVIAIKLIVDEELNNAKYQFTFDFNDNHVKFNFYK